ncbi:MAG: hypothetical protein JXB39_16040 [Deltaproteobacteria bacterium]|nr:hypothetical protein [Deltaproteobacteria bacterium]
MIRPVLPLLAFLLATPRVVGAVPSRVAATLEAGTSIPDLAITPDGTFLGFVESGAAEIWILDTRSWDTTAYAPCASGDPSGITLRTTESGLLEGFVGCGDGSVAHIVTAEDGTIEIADHAFPIGTDPVLAVESDDTYVYVLTDPSKGNLWVHRLDPVSSTVDGDGSWPSTLSMGGFEDSGVTEGFLFLIHGGDNLSKVDLATGSASISQENLGGRDIVDVHVLSASEVFCADTSGGVLRFVIGTNDWIIVLDREDDLESNTAVGVDDVSSEASMLVYDAGAGELVVFSYDTYSGNPGSEILRFPAEDVSEFVFGGGYAFGGGSTGLLQVFTDRPWVEVLEVSPDKALLGEEVELTFTSDMEGDWEIRRGGTVAREGTLLASGTVTKAGQEVSAMVEVDASFAEGANDLWVFVTSQSGTLGHDLATVLVDNPPSRVHLGPEAVGFGNAQITVSFDGIPDADLSHYVFYLTTTAFSPEDWPTGGPEFDGPDDQEAPFEVSAAPGAAVVYTISPLTNSQTYYVAVRAYDQGGQEGEMSDVQSATPRKTIAAAALAGETGGWCGTRTPLSLGLALVGLLVALCRRARPAVLGLAACALLLPERAEAGFASVEIRYGPYHPASEAVQTVYGKDGHQVLWVQGGPRWHSWIGLDLGVGFYQELATTVSVDASHTPSSEHTMLTAWPFQAALTGRLDVLEEQVLVPKGSIGLDYWLWRENWYVNPDVSSEDDIAGGELGWHWSVGGDLLLDVLEPSRASGLEARTGIEDTYLTAEYRKQVLGPWGGDGVSLFDGSMVTIGLRLHF